MPTGKEILDAIGRVDWRLSTPGDGDCLFTAVYQAVQLSFLKLYKIEPPNKITKSARVQNGPLRKEVEHLIRTNKYLWKLHCDICESEGKNHEDEARKFGLLFGESTSYI